MERVEKQGLKLPNKNYVLSDIQKEVLHLIADEFLTIKQIAQRRNCSLNAVYKIIKRLKQKGVYAMHRPCNRIIDFGAMKIATDSIKRVNYKDLVFNKRCYFCDYWEILHRHHIEPRSKGGKNKDINYLFLCPNCHSILHDRGKLVYQMGFYYIYNRKDDSLIRKPTRMQLSFPRHKEIKN